MLRNLLKMPYSATVKKTKSDPCGPGSAPKVNHSERVTPFPKPTMFGRRFVSAFVSYPAHTMIHCRQQTDRTTGHITPPALAEAADDKNSPVIASARKESVWYF